MGIKRRGHLFCKGGKIHMLNLFVVMVTGPDCKSHRALVFPKKKEGKK